MDGPAPFSTYGRQAMEEHTSTNEISEDTLQAAGGSGDVAARSPNPARIINQSRDPGANTADLKPDGPKANGVSRDFFDYDIPISDQPGLDGYLELIGRRLAGDYEIDEFGCDPLYGQMGWPLFDLLYRNYWRVESTGVDYVQASGRAMIGANHSGGS